MTYPTITAFLADPTAPARPEVPPGGPIDPRDDGHMTYLAMTVKKRETRIERIDVLFRQAKLLESIAPGDPCIARILEWHGELIAEELGTLRRAS